MWDREEKRVIQAFLALMAFPAYRFVFIPHKTHHLLSNRINPIVTTIIIKLQIAFCVFA